MGTAEAEYRRKSTFQVDLARRLLQRSLEGAKTSTRQNRPDTALDHQAERDRQVDWLLDDRRAAAFDRRTKVTPRRVPLGMNRLRRRRNLENTIRVKVPEFRHLMYRGFDYRCRRQKYAIPIRGRRKPTENQLSVNGCQPALARSSEPADEEWGSHAMAALKSSRRKDNNDEIEEMAG